jgi:hypothetical protein
VDAVAGVPTEVTRVPSRAVDFRGIVCCTVLSVCVLLQGCGRSNPEPPPDILKAQREALEKAKATEKTLQDAAQQRDAQMESQQK